MESKNILITGCSSGIGKNAAITLHNKGWRVFATCRKKSDCDRLLAEGYESFVLEYRNEKTIISTLEKIYLKKGF